MGEDNDAPVHYIHQTCGELTSPAGRVCLWSCGYPPPWEMQPVPGSGPEGRLHRKK